MKRIAALTLLWVALGLTGCRAPIPSTKGVFAPYGSTRVSPPSTNSYGSADAYYQPRQSSTAPARSEALRRDPSDSEGQEGMESVLVNNAESEVIQASFAQLVEESDETATRASRENGTEKRIVTETPIRITEAALKESAEPKGLQLNGMPVRDATATAQDRSGPREAGEPALFVPQGRLIELAQLPDAPRNSSSPQVGFGSGPFEPVGSGVRRSSATAAPPASLSPTPAVRSPALTQTAQTSQSVANGSWKPRYSQ